MDGNAMRTLYLCGAGNPEGVRLALRVNAHGRRWDRIVLLDDAHTKQGAAILGFPVVGGFDHLAAADPRVDEVVNLVARTTGGREAARRRLIVHGVPFTSLIHPSVDTEGSGLADDVLLYEGAVVGPGSTVGPGSVVFMGAAVGHGSRVGAGCVLAPGSVLNARVTLGDRVYVGTNATVLPEVRVGDDATVGACSAVVADVPSHATALGVPASVLSSEGEDGRSTMQPKRLPVDEVESLIRHQWADLLHQPSIAPHETFFDAGGNSLLAIQACARLGQALGVGLSPTVLFRFPTPRALAVHLSSSEGASVESGALQRGAARRTARARRL
jgi:sugar O-acyltransferase (sialic acid O-acetyltransferase NeuD family)